MPHDVPLITTIVGGLVVAFLFGSIAYRFGMPPLVGYLVAIIVIGKSLAALAIVRLFGHPSATVLTIAASLAQICEFSFILATLGVSLGLLSQTGRDLILGGAILSILLNPLLFLALDRLRGRKGSSHEQAHAADPAGPPLPHLTCSATSCLNPASRHRAPARC